VGLRSGTARARRGAFVVLLGPDGSGKTTVARAVLEQVGSKGRYFHFLPVPIRDLLTQVPQEAVLIEKHRDVGNRIFGILRILRNLVRAWFAYFISIRPAVRDGSIVVGDRWLYGYLTQPVAMKFYGPDWLARLAIRIMPQPNLTVALTAPAELIHARKPELSLAEIEEEIGTLRKELPDAFVIDATDDPISIARQLVEQVELGGSYRVYPPLLGQVLLPETSRADALAGAALYSPARSRGLIGQRLGRGMIRLFGTGWLSRADFRGIPLDIALQAALMEFLHEYQISPDSLAFHARTQSGRQGFSFLAIARGRPVGFVRAGPRGTLDAECQALRLLEERPPTRLRIPRLVGRTEIGGLDLALTTSVLSGYHHPPANPSLDLIVGQIKAGLADLPRPTGTPEHWEPMHGDLTPWNLREDNSGLVLVDWESVGWGPPEADRVFYAASSTAINRRIEAGSPDSESVAFWLERIDKAVNSRDARLRRAMIDVLRSWLV
jgi:thymidylate kinase